MPAFRGCVSKCNNNVSNTITCVVFRFQPVFEGLR